jgi:GNAT superfamily N-acetyltransferase
VVHSARHNGRIVASFAIAPKVFQVDGRRRVVGKTMDMFTDPAYQGMGLIKRCTDAVFEQARAAGMAGWYVTPSVNSYPIFTGKWGYREDFRLAYRARVLRYAPVLAAAIRPAGVARVAGSILDGVRRLLPKRRLKLPTGYTLAELTSFGEETDRLWGRVAGGYRVALVRDAAYLRWRYLANPDDYTVLGLSRGGDLVGIVVLTETVRRGVPVGELVDYVAPADDDEVFRLLVRAAIDHSVDRGHALIQAWSVVGTSLDARLRRAGLPLHRTDVKFLVSPGYPDEVIYDGQAWLLTQGDGNDV